MNFSLLWLSGKMEDKLTLKEYYKDEDYSPDEKRGSSRAYITRSKVHINLIMFYYCYANVCHSTDPKNSPTKTPKLFM